VAYDPLALFANGESGAWYDPSDLSTLFQDSAGTIPVTEDGQPVGRMLDKSGNDNHATQSVSSKRPTYKSVDGVQWLDFDGIDDILETGNINFSQTDKMSVFCQLQSLINRSSVLVELTNSSQPPGAFSVFVGNGDEGRNYGWSTCSGNGTQAYAASSDLPIPFTLTNTVLIDRSGSSLETLFKPRLNGEPAQIDFPFPHDQNGNFANDNLYIGARGLGGKYLEGKIYGLIVRGVTSTTQEVTDTEKYLTSLTVRDFKPNHLFENNEVGAWYDPSDLSTLFQDPEGTIPVTQDGQPVGLMLDKSKEIELLSELISNGEFTTDTTDWSAHNAVLSIENGTIKVDDSANAGDNSSAQQQLTGLVIGKSYILSGQIVSSNNSGNIVLWQEGENTSVTNNASFILAYGAQEFNGSGVFTATGTTATIGLVSNSVGITYFDNISASELNGIHGRQSVSTRRLTYTDSPDRLLLDKVDDAIVIVIPTGGFVGSLVVATDKGTASYGVDVPAGNYTLGGQHFAGDSINGVLLREGEVSGSDLAAVEQTFVDNGATASYGQVTDFSKYWVSRNDITVFPLIDTSNAVNLGDSWASCRNITSFPLIDTSNVTNFNRTWYEVESLVTFPLLDTSSGVNFVNSWRGCKSLLNFPAINISGGDAFNLTWFGCNDLTTFPPNMFDNCTATNFDRAFFQTNLTQESIDGILVSINSNGTSNGNFDQSGGSAPSSVGEAAITDLVVRGWSVDVTGGFQS